MNTWKARAVEAQALLDALMLTLEPELEKDKHGNSVYVFHDGEVADTAALPAPTAKRRTRLTTKCAAEPLN